MPLRDHACVCALVTSGDRDGYHQDFNGTTTLTTTAYRSIQYLIMLFFLRENMKDFMSKAIFIEKQAGLNYSWLVVAFNHYAMFV